MSSLLKSQLHDEKTFYDVFLRDLKSCQEEVIIESPYITTSRMQLFWPVFEKLLKKKVKIYVVTKDFDDLEENLRYQSEVEVRNFERLGIQTFLCIGNHHRKLAILDRKVLWEGSLNILSQMQSREIMRRIESEQVTMEMFNFLKFKKFL